MTMHPSGVQAIARARISWANVNFIFSLLTADHRRRRCAPPSNLPGTCARPATTAALATTTP